MLGWTILFAILTGVSAIYAKLQPETAYWSACSAVLVFGLLVFLSLCCTFAGKAIQNFLREFVHGACAEVCGQLQQ